MLKIKKTLNLNQKIEGFYHISDDEYFKAPGVSNSDLSLFLRSPAHYESIKLKGMKRASTNAQNFGSALHCYILERNLYDIKVAVAPVVDKRTNQGKAAWAAFQIESDGKIIITEEEAMAIEEIGKKVMSYEKDGKPFLKDILLNNGYPELAMFWRDEDTNTLCRAKADYIHHKKVLVDLKTTQDASPRGFARSIAKYGYHRQAAMYLWGASEITGHKYTDFYFIAVEKEPPYAVAVYKASQSMIEQGYREIKKALADLDSCVVKGEFYSYQVNGPEEINLPAWAIDLGEEGVDEL